MIVSDDSIHCRDYFIPRHLVVDEECKASVTKLRDWTLKEWLTVVRIPLILLILFGVIRWLYPAAWLGSVVIMYAADSVIVASILLFLVELGSMSRIIQRVGDDLTAKLVGKGLPKALQGQINEIVKTSLVRENFKKSYTIHEASSGFLDIDIEITYELRNYSDGPIKYAPSTSEEIFYKPEFQYLEYRLPGENGFSFTHENLQSYVQTIEETQVKSVEIPKEKKLTILPLSENKNYVCYVRCQYKVQMPEEYSDIQSFAGPTINATVELREKPPWLRFTSLGPDIEHIPNSTTWVFNRPFIQGQHVRVWWFREN